MSLRILTGTITPRKDSETSGRAVISFNPHEVAGDGKADERHSAGADGNFREIPGKIFSLRQIRVRDNTSGGHKNDHFIITHESLTRHQVEVIWETTGGGRGGIEKISYMIVGDVND